MDRGIRLALFVLFALLAGIVAAYFLFTQEPEPVVPPATPPPGPLVALPPGPAVALPPERLVTEPRLPGTLAAETGHRAGAATPLPRPPGSALDPKERAILLAALLSRIDAAPGARGPENGGPSPPASDAGTLSKEYLQEQIQEIIPLVKQCYEQALLERPGTAGKLVVRFSIVGDPELGGLVEQSEIVDTEGGAADEGLSTCVRETMYALRLKAPEGGGRVVVTYPFIFRKSDAR